MRMNHLILTSKTFSVSLEKIVHPATLKQVRVAVCPCANDSVFDAAHVANRKVSFLIELSSRTNPNHTQREVTL